MSDSLTDLLLCRLNNVSIQPSFIGCQFNVSLTDVCYLYNTLESDEHMNESVLCYTTVM